MRNVYADKIIKKLTRLGRVYSLHTVFGDFVEMGALSISNCIDKAQYEKREETYLLLIGKYQKEEQQLFPEMFADLVMALEYELTWRNAPSDVLGDIFNALELGNRFKGQVFTPQHICDMMGAMVCGEGKQNEAIDKHGFISLCEPACGAGAMILGFAKAMADADLNYCAQLYAEATDVDLKCVHMCYIQLALYGIPAVVIHGNSLTLEEFSRWYTPVYILNGWQGRLRAVASKENKSPIIEQLSLPTGGGGDNVNGIG